MATCHLRSRRIDSRYKKIKSLTRTMRNRKGKKETLKTQKRIRCSVDMFLQVTAE